MLNIGPISAERTIEISGHRITEDGIKITKEYMWEAASVDSKGNNFYERRYYAR